MIQGYKNTILISFFSLILSVILGLIMAIMKKSKSQTLKFLATSFSEIIIYEPISIAKHNEKYKDTTKAVMIPLQNVSGLGIAMRKNQPELKAKVDALITKAKTDGTFDKIRDKYLKGQKDEFEKATGMKFFF